MAHSTVPKAIVLITLILSMICLTNGLVELPTNNSKSCGDARMDCAYRTGCGMALQHYVTHCTPVLQGRNNDCPVPCLHALIGLSSTAEGQDLMQCACPGGDRHCMLAKQRVEICRPSVLAMFNKTRTSCSIATWMCNGESLCQTAFNFYNLYCRSMFFGQKCTPRCRNSIKILKRQDKAAKLNTCFCDGNEDYDCKAIHRNMNILCYKKHNDYHDISTNKISSSSPNTVGIEAAFVINRITFCLSAILLLLNK